MSVNTKNQKALDKKELLADTVAEIKQRFGDGAIMMLGEARRVDIEAIPTGSFSLDLALGIGGIPKGRIVEIFGGESSGKTTLAEHIVASVQKRGGVAAFVDAEHALDPEYAQRIGVKINDLLISQPDTGEEALQIVESLVRSGAVELIVVDSVAALTPRAEIEGEIGDSHIALQARLMSQALRKLTAISAKSGTTLIFINQIRMKIGMVFGNPEDTPGGKALKFYSSVRIELRRAAKIKKGEEIIGNRIKAKVVKNKVAPPFRSAEFDIMWNHGIVVQSDVLNLAVTYGVVKKKGGWYAYNDKQIGQGLEGPIKFLKENPKIFEDIKKAILQAIKKPIA
ncbi:MAG: recombinase RecA [Candidatus Portnoybacteria bacterium CG10_big_fil_rev_8_21_14_0_10_40_22]|uniref:Protein RecA n=1 Tax=Candidatus Portnoybacteria bacterium CG10_big_fil_rev_8_21_14_0_10_40_22 TaxID=1974814 RepID=A0A2M8KFX7_9BACT|nr:MAG: recombinase RecA [Candidatus Portnoybacteria bacterium CG10_big_fil_rev_8_21_14_0_10_40_22]